MKQILDQFGHPVNTERLKETEATPTITGVRSIVSNEVSSNLTPVKLANILRRANEGDIQAYLELAEEMEEKEPQYLSVLGTRKRAISQLEIVVEAASEDKEDKINADIIRNFLKRDTLEDELFDILDAIGKGFSVTEIIWDMSEKEWMPAKLNRVNPAWFTFDKSGEIPLLRNDANDPQPLTPYKYITAFIKAKSGLPIRSGLARPIAWYYLFKNFDIKSWVNFIEVFGQPLRVGKYGTSATEEDKRKLLRAVYNIGSDASAIIPESMMIEFIKADNGSGSSTLYKDFASYCDQAISKVVLGQTTTTDAISGGHAVSKEHNEVRKDIAKSDAKQLAAILKRDLIKPIIDLNRGAPKAYPNITIGNFESEDLTALADSISKLVPCGLKVSHSQVLAKFGLEAPKDASDILGTINLNQRPPEPPALNKALNSSLNDNTNHDEIDKVVDELEGDWQEVIEPIIKPIEDIINKANSFDEAIENLTKAYPDMNTEALTKKIAESSFRARTNGISGIEP